MNYFIVTYTGPFGFIKPWTAVRDSETFSQQFLTPSIVEGMEKKLFPELLEKHGVHKIIGHRLSYKHITGHQEVIQTRGWNTVSAGTGLKKFDRPTSIIERGIMHEPVLHLAFVSLEDANIAAQQHLCLARNEDVLLPVSVNKTTKDSFEQDGELYPGYELVFEKNEQSFLVGYHRVSKEPMFGWIRIVGEPVTQY
ncbi:MAG: hypothetical protein WC967_06340 [Balneolaceae bacterium]